MKSRTLSHATLLVATAMFLAPWMALGQGAGPGISQFHVGSVGDRYLEVFNPGEFEMFVLAIAYGTDGRLTTDHLDHDGVCRGVVAPPHGTADQALDFAPDTSSSERPDNGAEFIAVPTEGPHTGVFDTTGNLGLGVYIHLGRGANAAPLPPAIFNPPTDSGDRDMLVNCACCELDELGLTANLLSGVGINCPGLGSLTCDARAPAPAP